MNCTKPFSITIESGLSPAAWWTMESAEPIIDVVAGADLARTAGTGVVSSTAGKVNLAETGAFDSDIARFSNTTASLAPQGTDFHLFGWSFLETSGAPGTMQQFITIEGDTWGDFLQIRFQDDGTWTLSSLFVLLLAGAIPMDVFFFWHLRFDSSTGNMEFSINEGAVSTSVPVAAPLSNTGTMTVQFSNGFTPPYLQKLDELAWFVTALTPDEIAGIYNGGAGRTFP
jgi:hypothetical protein